LELVDERCETLQRYRNDNLDEQLNCLRHCLRGLPATYRNAVEVRYQEQLRGERLAARLQITLANAKKRLLRARKMLLECLQRRLEVEEAW
jgi:DNA-directed RNA polymerase specialized sigma24 family protein